MKVEFHISRIKHFFLIVLIIATINPYVCAQQDIFYGFDDFIGLKYNPAYTGNKDFNDLMLLSRQQWVGFEGAPQSYLLLSHFTLKDNKAAIGAELSNFTLGPITETGIFFYYSYSIRINDRSTLAFGLKAGTDLYQANLNNILLIDPADILFENNVDLKMLPNIGAGLHYNTPEYFIDISFPGIIRNKLNPAGIEENTINNKQDRLFILGGGTGFEIYDDLSLKAGTKIWIVNWSQVLLSIKLSAIYQNSIGAGINYRPEAAIGGFAWYRINDILKFGYLYELQTGLLNGPHSGTHEIYIGYNFSFTKSKTLSPRRF